ncbi:MAG: hypothetical protein KUG77_17185 [Nannocystaceae bacterium]|nr:hypothetical protein [Nannocystaceae bacterium]
MAPRTSVAIVANGGRTLSGFRRKASLTQASRAFDVASARLWDVPQTEEVSTIVSVGTVSAEFPSVQRAERAMASMFHEHAQSTDPSCPAVALWDVLAIAHAPG